MVPMTSSFDGLQSRLSSLLAQVIWYATTQKENVRNIAIVRSA
jgi:hypothetical protein